MVIKALERVTIRDLPTRIQGTQVILVDASLSRAKVKDKVDKDRDSRDKYKVVLRIQEIPGIVHNHKLMSSVVVTSNPVAKEASVQHLPSRARRVKDPQKMCRT